MNVAGNSGPKPVVNWKGKPYSVSHFCPAVVLLVEQKVADMVYADADALTGRAKERQLKYADEAVGAGQHRYGESLFNRRVGTLRGSPLFLWACVAHNHPEFTPDDARRMAENSPLETSRAMRQVEPDFFAELVRLGAMSADQMTQAAEMRAAEGERLEAKFSPPAGSEGTPNS